MNLAEYDRHCDAIRQALSIDHFADSYDFLYVSNWVFNQDLRSIPVGHYNDNGEYQLYADPKTLEDRLNSFDRMVSILENNTTIDPFKKLAILHHEITSIHPLKDGNGRTSRILLQYHAAYLGLGFILITDRDQYLNALETDDIDSLALLFEESEFNPTLLPDYDD